MSIKSHELSSHEERWRDLTCMLLSERRQSEKATCCIIITISHSGNDKTMETKKISDCQGFMMGEGERGDEVEHRGFFGQRNYSV